MNIKFVYFDNVLLWNIDYNNNNINEFISFVSEIKNADTKGVRATLDVSHKKKRDEQENPLANRGFTEIPKINKIEVEE